MTSEPPRTICLVAAIPSSLVSFMSSHVRVLSQDHRIVLVANNAPPEVQAMCGPLVTFHRVDIRRDISPVADIRALVSLWRLFRRHRFDAVQSITPKAGLLSMTAARVARIPVRVHWFTGQVWATLRGIPRHGLKLIDRLMASMATHLLADSPSQRDFLVREGVVSAARVTVLGRGSVCGIDVVRFRPDAAVRATTRRETALPSTAVVALYLGRLKRDKGVGDLAAAFVAAARRCPDLHLLLVGPDEESLRPAVTAGVAEMIERVRFVDYTTDPARYMAAADFFVLPSRREGFGQVVLEAAACELPTVGTRIYGLTDAIAEGESGILTQVGDVTALTEAMVLLTSNAAERRRLGEGARTRAERDFSEARLTSELARFYRRLL